MTRSVPPVRYIKPVSIRIGDTIKVTETWLDAEVIKIGKVAKRENYTHHTEYMTTSGIVLVTHWRTGVENGPKHTITLLKREHNVSEIEGMLF